MKNQRKKVFSEAQYCMIFNTMKYLFNNYMYMKTSDKRIPHFLSKICRPGHCNIKIYFLLIDKLNKMRSLAQGPFFSNYCYYIQILDTVLIYV